MQTRRLLICLALLLLLLGLLRTLDEDRGAPAPPLAPAGDLESHALSGPPPEGERAKVPGEPASSGDPGEAEELALPGSVTRESDGEPIVGARVLVYDRRPLYEGAPWLTEYCGDLRDLRTDLSPIAETRTAGLGTFRVAVPAPGTWAVVVRHPPLKPASGVMRTGEDQWFSLRESARMSFRVVDETDRPVAGAQAFVFASGPSSRVLSHAVSDAQGRFEVEGCPSYDELLIRADGYADRLIEDLCDRSACSRTSSGNRAPGSREKSGQGGRPSGEDGDKVEREDSCCDMDASSAGSRRQDQGVRQTRRSCASSRVEMRQHLWGHDTYASRMRSSVWIR